MGIYGLHSGRYGTRESQMGLMFCTCWNDHISLKLQKCGRLIQLIVFAQLLAVVLPYIVSVSKNIVPAFLPLVSEAGGYPPASGIFSICLILNAFCGFMVYPIFYVTISHRNIKGQQAHTSVQ
ncbi:hypothetical protein CEXT_109261 [Caerostris extrusa]|uniref:CWH43-like N-terminal domain-containing protein n=1 Tax=Caerostris extrusa TaxID=172846 RepID=A0AAV4UH61_CAEEX|nr:hypothetical protein CEXT_109261 [Caerostris extrusa]